VIASVWSVAAEHFLSFGWGLLVGFYLSNRFRIVKRNGDERDHSHERGGDE
jgi:hypothetical protein